MLEEKAALLPEETGLALLVEPLGALREDLLQATGSNRLNHLVVDGSSDICALIASRKPDLIIMTEDVYHGFGPGFRDAVSAAKVTSTLPLLILSPNEIADRFARYGCAATLAMDVRAVLRRERPQAVSGTVSAKGFLLDEASMRLFHDGRFMDLRMSEVTLIGPLMDNPDVVFDRSTLAALALGERLVVTENRRLDFYINQLRRRIRARLGLDPVKSLRGKGYTFRGDC